MNTMRSGILAVVLGAFELAMFGTFGAARLAAQGASQVPPLPANDLGRKAFETRCARCHGGDGKGAEMGTNIVERLTNFRADDRLTALIHTGIPASGMPPTAVEGPELASLIRFVHSITPSPVRCSARGWKICSCGATMAKSICCAVPVVLLSTTDFAAMKPGVDAIAR
jgi:mono/diheme cytochrome c family protein